MKDDKNLNEVESGILENPINNTKIDITDDLTKMVEEVNNINSMPKEEKVVEEVIKEKEVPVIELKPEVEESIVIPLEKHDVQNIPVPDVNSNNNQNEIKIENQNGTVISSTSSDDKNIVVDENEKKNKLPFNLPVVLIVMVLCIVLGFVLWNIFRNGNEDSNKNEGVNVPVVTESDDVIVTKSDDFVATISDDVLVSNSDDFIE